MDSAHSIQNVFCRSTKMGRKKQTFINYLLFSFYLHLFAEYIPQILIICFHLLHIQNHVQDTHEIRTNQNKHWYILLPTWLFINLISLQFTVFLFSNTSTLQKVNNQLQFQDHITCFSLDLLLLPFTLHIHYVTAYNWTAYNSSFSQVSVFICLHLSHFSFFFSFYI